MKDIATKTTTSYILETYQLSALKKYGQNFLIDKQIVEKIIACGDIDSNTAVIEIGPGIGAMTQQLLRKSGYVQCYEIDERLKEVYDDFFKDENVTFIFEDFLKIDLKQVVTKLKETFHKVVIVSNVPYYITTAIIEKVICCKSKIDQMIFMVQKEVAQKLTSEYKSPLTFILQDMGTITYEFTVSKHVFIPKPHVDSAIINISLYQPFDEAFYQLLNDAFKQRRKTIYNNLKEYPNIKEVLAMSNIPYNKRSEELTLVDFKTIQKNISHI